MNDLIFPLVVIDISQQAKKDPRYAVTVEDIKACLLYTSCAQLHQAAAWKATGQCNCAQAVMKAFEDKLPVDADTLMKLCAGYAAGMGCMESTLSLIHISVWGKNCTHCMACICYCPKEAIEYGKKSKGKPRYHFEALERKQQDV